MRFEIASQLLGHTNTSIADIAATLCYAEVSAFYHTFRRKSRRQELHGKIARVLEERFPHSQDSEPELLAHQLSVAGRTEAAVPPWQKAGELALKRMALNEAISHLSKRLELVATLPPSA